jgi:hypothetical protein
MVVVVVVRRYPHSFLVAESKLPPNKHIAAYSYKETKGFL